MASQQDFFSEEARMARAALRNLVKQTGEKLQQDSDPRPLIRQRPWISLLAAVGGGMVAGYMVTPPRIDAEEKRRLRALRKLRKRRSADRLQKSIVGAIAPALRTFAATAAGALVHNFQQASNHNNHRPTRSHKSADEFAEIPNQRIQI